MTAAHTRYLLRTRLLGVLGLVSALAACDAASINTARHRERDHAKDIGSDAGASANSAPDAALQDRGVLCSGIEPGDSERAVLAAAVGKHVDLVTATGNVIAQFEFGTDPQTPADCAWSPFDLVATSEFVAVAAGCGSPARVPIAERFYEVVLLRADGHVAAHETFVGVPFVEAFVGAGGWLAVETNYIEGVVKTPDADSVPVIGLGPVLGVFSGGALIVRQSIHEGSSHVSSWYRWGWWNPGTPEFTALRRETLPNEGTAPLRVGDAIVYVSSDGEQPTLVRESPTGARAFSLPTPSVDDPLDSQRPHIRQVRSSGWVLINYNRTDNWVRLSLATGAATSWRTNQSLETGLGDLDPLTGLVLGSDGTLLQPFAPPNGATAALFQSSDGSDWQQLGPSFEGPIEIDRIDVWEQGGTQVLRAHLAFRFGEMPVDPFDYEVLRNGMEVRSLPTFQALSRDGRCVAYAAPDGNLRFFDVVDAAREVETTVDIPEQVEGMRENVVWIE